MLRLVIRSLACALLFSNLLLANSLSDDIGTLTSLESEPSGIIDGHVNVITGDFIDYEVDMVIPGPVPLLVDRTLLHNNYKPTLWYRYTDYECLTKWQGPLSEHILVFKDYHSVKRGEYIGHMGDSVIFKWTKDNGGNPIVNINYKMLRRGITNNSQGVIGAVTNVRHNQLFLNKESTPCSLLKSDGTKVIFGPAQEYKLDDFYECKVEKEYRPDNLRIQHTTCKRALKNLFETELSSYVCINGATVACDGRQCKRHFKKVYGAVESVRCLALVERPNAPNVSYDYWDGAKIELPREYVGKNKDGDPLYLYPYLVEAPKIRRKYYEDHRFLEVHYYKDEYVLIHDQLRVSNRSAPTYNRVSKLLAPLGCDPTPIPKYEFDYYLPDGEGKGGVVGVYNANHHLTNYVINSHQRIREIQKFTKDKKCYSVENLYFGPQGTQHEIELNARTFGLANSPKKTFCRVFRYDMEGNIFEDMLFGNLTGKGEINLEVSSDGYPITACEFLSKKHGYSQDRFHLLLESTDGKISESYRYVPETNIILAKFTSNEKGIFLRNFYDYDENSLVIRHIVDDGVTNDRDNLTGVTLRKIEVTVRSKSYPFGLPLQVSHYYLDNGVERLLSFEKNSFDQIGQLIVKESYDANGELKLREEWKYNAHCKVTEYINSMNQRILYYYDLNDNMFCEHGPDLGLVKRFEYDYMNRLIAEIEEHPDGTTRKTYCYDWMGNRVQSIDAFGNLSSVEYDEFQRPILKRGAPIPNGQGVLESPITKFTYDEMSHPTSVTDPYGNVTIFKHTLYGKPYYIRYPDGSEEHFEYDLYGRLIKEIAKNGTTTLYTLDAQDRITHKQVYSISGDLLLETKAGFNTFNILWETDPMGVKTTYSYDNAGRKIGESKAGTTTHYEYDALGNIHRVILDDLVKVYEYDALKRILEERQESNGKLIDCSRYTYDSVGRKTRTEKQTQEGLSVIKVVYDTHGIPIEATDPNEQVTYSRLIPNYFNQYGQKVLCLELVDPMGQVTRTIHDAQGQVVQVEKKSPFGALIQKTETKRDFNHLALETIHTVFLPDEKTKTIVNAIMYDTMQRPITLIEAKGSSEERQTRSEFNLAGEKTRQIKVDGASLNYDYDGLGRLIECRSSDNSINYHYQYDKKSRPTLVENMIQKNTTKRFYDESDHIIKEVLANGLNLEREYDTAGRLIKLTLPDRTGVNYHYQGTQYTTIDRTDATGKILYQHCYNQYDEASRLCEASTIFNLDKIHYKYNMKGDLISQKSTTFEENLTYDPVGNLIKRNFNDFQGSHDENFTYDDLYQLNNESGEFTHTYTNDSMYNRCSKDGKNYTHNALNQLLNDEENTYNYDLSGNLTSIQGKNPAIMSYDALDRMVSLTIEGMSYQFTYDEKNRCLTQKCKDLLDSILYLDQNDIGTFDKKGCLKHFRVLGLGRGAETGASVAIEIQQEVYAPFHDHRGNIIALKNKKGKLAEAYRYSAFGEEKIFNSSGTLLQTSRIDNPWRYSSKRTFHRLVFFGRRIYNPSTGSWLTPDPIGYDGGPNLYAYLNHNPLTHHDLYGLIDEGPGLWDRTCDFVRDTFNTIRDGISYAFEKTREGVSLVGCVCREIFHEFVPIPLIRDLAKGFGHLLAEGTLSNFVPWYKQDPSQLYTTSNCEQQKHLPRNPKVIQISVNGIRTKKIAAHDNANHYAVIVEMQVDFFYIQDDGGVYNIGEVILNKIGIDTDPVAALVQAIRSAIHEVGGVDGGGMVVLVAFSQGGQVLSNAIEFLNSDERSILYVGTFGSATIINDTKGLAYVHNYIAWNDLVSQSAIALDAPLEYANAVLGNLSYVTWLKPVEQYPIDHRFQSKTYRAGQEDFAQDMHFIMQEKGL